MKNNKNNMRIRILYEKEKYIYSIVIDNLEGVDINEDWKYFLIRYYSSEVFKQEIIFEKYDKLIYVNFEEIKLHKKTKETNKNNLLKKEYI